MTLTYMSKKHKCFCDKSFLYRIDSKFQCAFRQKLALEKVAVEKITFVTNCLLIYAQLP